MNVIPKLCIIEKKTCVETPLRKDVIMNSSFTVPLSRLIKEFSLEKIYIPPDQPDVMIQSTDISRPGLNLTGFYEYFDPKRIQVVGRMEYAYLEDLSENSRRQRIFELFEQKFPCLILTRGLGRVPGNPGSGKQNGVTVLRTNESTSSFTGAIISTLNTELAPRITRHGSAHRNLRRRGAAAGRKAVWAKAKPPLNW